MSKTALKIPLEKFKEVLYYLVPKLTNTSELPVLTELCFKFTLIFLNKKSSFFYCIELLSFRTNTTRKY